MADLALKRDTGELRTTFGDGLAKDARELFGRAAFLRMEAEALRVRTRTIEEEVVRSEYLKIADRWTTLAASLETEALSRVTDGS